MGKGDGKRPTLISEEENELRWAYKEGRINISKKEFDKRVKEIRERTGKP